MKKLLYILGTVLSVVVLFSCEPGRDENGDLLFNVNEPSYDWEPRFLSKVEDSAGGNTTYSYDGANRLTEVNSTQNSTSQFKFTYAADSVKSAAVTYEDSNGIFTSDFTFEYNTDKLVSRAKGTIKQGANAVSDISIEVIYSNKKPTTITSTVTPVITPADSIQTKNELGYSGDQLTSWEKTITSSGTNSDEMITFDLFDDNPNGFAQLPMVYRILSTVYNEGPWAVAGFSINNFTKITVDGESAEYIYKYDPKKYPTEASTTGKKFTFLYKN
ncbi:RHS repeat protein [Chryseobacterium salipaludis]|uniref:RHS repeat protein n=1 Tax=Chryseobacterium TaxID=59732 RepID=UPI001FF6AFA1|nr:MULTISPECIES: RHS repeat protein [Chryseobacterium]MCJ8497189.1 RHS repeat protein [Chryseobacterium salipaludis]MCX3295596.1 RHS repeat protein [Planobacterium sp. JC490]